MKPIRFNDDMVQAILDERKTQTRRIISEGNLIGLEGLKKAHRTEMADQELLTKFASRPYYKGDILWVRETWAQEALRGDGSPGRFYYRADEDAPYDTAWKSSKYMPKEAARIFLRVTDVRAERLQEISGEDCVHEGVDEDALTGVGSEFARGIFSEIWDDTVKPEERARCGWDADPWVWVIRFERLPMYRAVPSEPETVFGVPIKEAEKVLWIYKFRGGKACTEEYVKGFEDGVQKAREEFETMLQTGIHSFIKGAGELIEHEDDRH